MMPMARLAALAVCSRAWLALFCGFFVVSASAQLPPLLVKPVVNAKPERILFVGNSYFYYNNSLHNHVSALVKADDAALGGRVQFKSATIGGAALQHHNLPHLLEPGRIGVAQPFQWVVMQGGSGESLSAQRREIFRKTATENAALVRAAGGQVALYMTHAYVKPHPRVNASNAKSTQTMYVDVGNDIQALVIPVGLAFEVAYQRYPNLKLHHPDGTHPGLLGTYLAACTTYAALYGRSPVGNAYRAEGAIDAEVALQLQQVAQDVVTQFFQ
jgi:hypothetical protein